MPLCPDLVFQQMKFPENDSVAGSKFNMSVDIFLPIDRSNSDDVNLSRFLAHFALKTHCQLTSAFVNADPSFLPALSVGLTEH